jgi:ATPase subunit of ABC transporter with duplicated ATPase domains
VRRQDRAHRGDGTGKTTLLRIIAGDLKPVSGGAVVDGGLGVMRQFIGSIRDDTTVRDLLVDLAPPAVRDGRQGARAAELAMMETTTRGRSCATPARSRTGGTPAATTPR